MAKRAKGKSLWDEAMEHWKANQGLVLQEGSYRLVYNRLEDIDWNTGKIINDDSDLVYLNGANIHYKSDKYYGIEYKVNRSVVPTEDSKRKITSVDFTMPSEEDWLAGIFDRMPYGLVKKNRTGIGATTLELMADRNSIIVVPTKALASSKKLSGRKTDRYYHYVGGETSKVRKQPSIDAFLTNWSIKPKKFIVVADSLPKLIRKLNPDDYGIVQYKKERDGSIIIPLENTEDCTGYINSHKREIFFTKTSDWSYEQEFRIVKMSKRKTNRYLDIKDAIIAVIINTNREGENILSAKCSSLKALLDSKVGICNYGTFLGNKSLSCKGETIWSNGI